jgi:hypothetical protein
MPPACWILLLIADRSDPRCCDAVIAMSPFAFAMQAQATRNFFWSG